jgi:hypothetical protein
MNDHVPAVLTLKIEAFRAIAAAVTEAEIGGGVRSVRISEITPNIELMRDAVAVELAVSGEQAGSGRPETWIVAGDGTVVAHLGEPRGEPDED